jgi:hypothetical protein
MLRKETQIFTHSLTFMNRSFQYNHQLIESMYQYTGIQNVLKLALIDIDIKTI